MPHLRIKTAAGEEALELEEFEAKVRAGELAGHCPVSFPPVTGEAWVRADSLELFRRLHEQHAPRQLYFARAFNLGRFPKLTAVFVIFNVAVYLLMNVGGPAGQDALVLYGAKAAPLIEDLGQLWRLLAANVVHKDGLHIAFNLFVLFNVGGALENVYRPLDYLLLLLASALGATLTSLWAMPDALTAGASGVVYGTLGALIVFGAKYRRILPHRYRPVLGEATIPIVAVFLYLGFRSEGVDNWAHVGGLGAGALTALWMRPRLLIEEQAKPPAVALRLAPFVLVAAVMALAPAASARLGAPVRPERLDTLGLGLDVPVSWHQTADRFGQTSFSNGLAGLGHAEVSLQAQLLDGTAIADAPAFAAELVRRQLSDGAKELTEHAPSSVTVAGLPGVAIDGSYEEEGVATRFRAVVVERGELAYGLFFEWPDEYGAYARVIDRLQASVRLVEPRALEEARARVMIEPASASMVASLGDTLARLGAHADAAKAYTRAVALAPDDWRARLGLGRALIAGGDLEPGCAAAGEVLREAPDEAGALEAVGDCRAAKGDRAGAVELLKRAVAKAPKDERLGAKLKRLVGAARP